MLGKHFPRYVTLALAGLCGSAIAACVRSTVPLTPEEAAFSHGIEKPRTADFNKQLAALQRTTAPFHNFDKAEQAGYGSAITTCWYHRDLGAMGYHYANPDLIEDGTVSLLEPEALMYEPGPAGQLHLVGLEYIIPIGDWTGRDRPTLLGEKFHRNDELGLYTLHVWLWRHNPGGMFADWNPKVSCKHAEEAEDRAP